MNIYAYVLTSSNEARLSAFRNGAAPRYVSEIVSFMDILVKRGREHNPKSTSNFYTLFGVRITKTSPESTIFMTKTITVPLLKAHKLLY